MAAVAAFTEIQDLAFTCPKVLERVYVTNGPSGWPETFERVKVDAALERLISTYMPTVDVAELVDVFIAKRELAEDPEPTSWFTIIGFLGRQLQISPKIVPIEVGIAFWGQIVIAMTTRGAN